MRTPLFILLGYYYIYLIKDQTAAEEVQDQPLHPDTDLVANILGNRPDGSSSTLAESLVPPIVTLNPPEAVESYVPQYCGGEVIAKVNEVDTLLSPGFPNSYPSDLHCVWILKAPPGYKVVGQFTEFDLTESDECSSDYVQIHGLTSTSRTEDYYTDNGKAPRHCGKTAPKDFGETVTSNAAALRLVFHSNQDDSCKGFAFQYRVETNQATCGDVSDGSEFEFTNSEYPNAVMNGSQHCSVQVSHDCEIPICQLRLDLIDFELMSPKAGNCGMDQFIIRANEPLPILCDVLAPTQSKVIELSWSNSSELWLRTTSDCSKQLLRQLHTAEQNSITTNVISRKNAACFNSKSMRK